MKNYLLNVFQKDWFLIIIVFILSLATHFIFFGYPASVVFDEVHIGHYILEYLKNAYVFDVHPPLGRLIFFAFSVLFGADINANFDSIGNTLPQWAILLRMVPMLAGALLPIIIYGILRLLNISKLISLFTAIIICFENSLIVQSRFILTDSILIFFGFLSLLLYLFYRKKNLELKYPGLVLYSAIFISSLAFSIKWTGLSFILLIVICEIQRRGIWKSSLFLLNTLIICLLTYLFIFSINLNLLYKSGTGDNFMSIEFQKTLENNNHFNNDNSIKQIGFYSKFIEVNKEMYRANTRLTNPHDYSSKWYTWPIETRSIYYWNKKDANNTNIESYIYLLGNPIIYWFGFISVFMLMYFSVKDKIFNDKISLFILIGFIINFLPFIFIGRIMFLYHYQTALVFSCMAIGIFISKIGNYKIRNSVLVIFIIYTLILFIYFSPLTYGLPITKQQLDSRMWIASWR